MAKGLDARASRGAAPEVHRAFGRVIEAFAGDRAVTYGKMFASMGLQVHGKIFAMHVKGLLVVKLPRDRVEQLLRLEHITRFDPGHGRVMKEWVAIAGDERSWVPLAREARRFVAAIAGKQ